MTDEGITPGHKVPRRTQMAVWRGVLGLQILLGSGLNHRQRETVRIGKATRSSAIVSELLRRSNWEDACLPPAPKSWMSFAIRLT
jgi:hypothetical protein